MGRFHLAERRLLLLVGDLSFGVAALLLVTYVQGSWESSGNAPVPVWCAVLLVIDLIITRATDALDLRRASNPFSGAYDAGRAWVVASLLSLAVPYLSAPLLGSRYAVVQFLGVGLLLRISWRAIYATVASQPVQASRYLIVGRGPGVATIAQAITTDLGADHEVVGVVAEGPAPTNIDLSEPPHLGDLDALATVVSGRGVTTIVLATGGEMSPTLQRLVIDAYEAGIRVIPMPTLYEDVTGRVLVDHAQEFWTATLPQLEQDWAYRLVTRVRDVVVGVIGLVITGLLLPVVVVALRLSGRGPILYRQTRLGKGGRPFTIWKFRSMVPDAEAIGGAQWSHRGDARVTRVGRVLRATRLDEFPQFWNILLGEMSLVGPRPERPEFIAALEASVPFYRIRLAVRPGLTGWAQVKAPYASSEADTLVKFQYDLYYLRHQSLYLDVLILVKTIGVVVGLRGV